MNNQPRMVLIAKDRFYAGDRLSDVIASTGRVVFDVNARRMLIDGVADLVSYSSEYSAAEMIGEMAKRALIVFTRDYGYFFYRSN